jgi:hypothetical protein
MENVRDLVSEVRAEVAVGVSGGSQVKDQPGVRDAPRVGQPVKDAPRVGRPVC